MSTLKRTDVYKLGHLEQYAPGTEEVYSYLEARKPGVNVVSYGLQYYIKKYLEPHVTKQHAERVLWNYEEALGTPTDAFVKNVRGIARYLGYWPVLIKAPPEGYCVGSQNITMSLKSTHRDYFWAGGYLEGLLLKVWATSTVATCSLSYRLLVEKYGRLTCDDLDHIPFSVHDFGYRGVSSEESAEVLGSAHAMVFVGSDTFPVIDFLDEYYPRMFSKTPYIKSVPATEHSVMCSYGRENEWDAFDNVLFNVYPKKAIVSVVSDTYSIWDVLTKYALTRKERIIARGGKVVFRPDSGDPVKIICGDPEAELPEARKGCLELLGEAFGYTMNSKGYKVLNPVVGLIYGDGMTYDRFVEMLETMKRNGWASSNLVIGVGGILLQNHSRDEFKFALKATHTIRDGESVEIYKDPITDVTKKSKKGFMTLERGENGRYHTRDQVSRQEEQGGILIPRFLDGKCLQTYSLEEVRGNITETCVVEEDNELL